MTNRYYLLIESMAVVDSNLYTLFWSGLAIVILYPLVGWLFPRRAAQTIYLIFLLGFLIFVTVYSGLL